MLIQAASAFAIVSIGLLAGVMLGIAMEQQTAQQLDANCWTSRQNFNDRLFRKVMPPAFVLTIVASCWATVTLRDTARVWMIAAGIGSLLVIALTVVLEIPLNERMAHWKPGAIPNEWQRSRDVWQRNHWLRTICGLGAFLCSIIALSIRAC